MIPSSNTTRSIAVLTALLVLLAPWAAVAVAQPAEVDTYATGRPVDSVVVEQSDGRLSLLVTDGDPQGTTLTINRDWLRQEIGKSIEFTRLYDDGNLISSYRITPQYVVVDIPHFSTQNITATTVDAQYEVSGSASSDETQHVINYDVDETGIAVLEIHGQGSKEGSQRIDQFFAEIDNATFNWNAGDIPRNVSLRLIGRGEQFGPPFNKSFTGVSNGESLFPILDATDYNTNVTISGAGQKEGTFVTQGIFRSQSDGDSQSVSFTYDQNNESIVFIGNTTTSTSVTEYASEWSTTTDWDSGASENHVIHENAGDRSASDVNVGYDTQLSGVMAYFTLDDTAKDEVTGNTGTVDDGTAISGIWNSRAYEFDASTPGSGVVLNADHASQQYTVGAWVRTTQSQSGDVFVARQGTTDTEGANNYLLTLGSGGVIHGGHKGTDGGFYSPEGTTSITDGNWHFVTYTYDGNDIVGFLNGTEEARANAPNPVTEPNEETVIGYQEGSTDTDWVGDVDEVIIFNRALTQSEVQDLYQSTGFITSGSKSFSSAVDPSTLNLTNASISGTVKATVESDPDDDGTFEEISDTVTISGKTGVTGLTSPSSTYRIRLDLEGTPTSTASVSRVDLQSYKEETATYKTEDPAIDVDGDGVNEASHTGKLNDGESVTVGVSEDILDGSHTFTTSTSNGSVVDWKYEGNNEARLHVKNVSVNGIDHPVDVLLKQSQSHVINVDNSDTVLGENSITLHTYTDTQTTTASRIDFRGEYENRAIIQNVTVNGQTYPVDVILAQGESTDIPIGNPVYGPNDIRTQLKENSTQDQYNAEFIWYPENRSFFTDVVVNGDSYGNPTFLGSGDVLSFNVTDSVSPGENTHVFHQNTSVTTTDTLDWVEKVEFRKNISVSLTERHATFIESSIETFDHRTTSGASFNFSVPQRVMRHTDTTVKFNGAAGVAHSTSYNGEYATITIEEQIPTGTQVNVTVEFLKYMVTGASDSLRNENGLSEPYLVDVGVSSPSATVTYETVKPAFNKAKWEVILTNPDEEAEFNISAGNISLDWLGTHDGFIVQRPQYSTDTYTGTTNVIHPSTVLDPNRTVTHNPPLFVEQDTDYVRMSNYSVTNLDNELNVVWTKVGPYHLQWTTDTSDSGYGQEIANVTTDGVTVLADGEPYEDHSRDGSSLVIDTSTDATWDVFTYDNPTIVSQRTVGMQIGETKTVTVEVHNPNAFTIHNVRLVTERSWVKGVEPAYQDIGPNETAAFDVVIHVPGGTAPAPYELGLNVSSTETGEVDTTDLTIDVGGGVLVVGSGVPNAALIAAGLVFFLALGAWGLVRSGRWNEIADELEKI